MTGDALVLVEELDRLGRRSDIDLLVGILVGHTVEALLELDVVVEVDARSDLPVGVFEAAAREGLKVRPIEFFEELSARALQLAHLPAVELLEEFTDRDIDLRDP